MWKRTNLSYLPSTHCLTRTSAIPLEYSSHKQYKPAQCELYTTKTTTHHFQSSLMSLKRRRGAAELAYKRVFTTQQNVRLPP